MRQARRTGYDPGVKKPVAIPTRWMVPSGVICVKFELQRTSPCGLGLDPMNVSVWVGPPGGVNSIVTSNDSGTKTSVLPTTWAGEKFPIPDPTVHGSPRR